MWAPSDGAMEVNSDWALGVPSNEALGAPTDEALGVPRKKLSCTPLFSTQFGKDTECAFGVT